MTLIPTWTPKVNQRTAQKSEKRSQGPGRPKTFTSRLQVCSAVGIKLEVRPPATGDVCILHVSHLGRGSELFGSGHFRLRLAAGLGFRVWALGSWVGAAVPFLTTTPSVSTSTLYSVFWKLQGNPVVTCGHLPDQKLLGRSK